MASFALRSSAALGSLFVVARPKRTPTLLVTLDLPRESHQGFYIASVGADAAECRNPLGR